MESFEYNGYSVVVTTTSYAGSGVFSPAMYTINRKGERDAVHRGQITQEFATSEDALNAASKAARAWIDENG